MEQRAAARNAGVTPGTEITPFASDPTSTPFPRGLLPVREGLTTPQNLVHTFVAENGWTDGETIGVYAGAAKNDVRKGAIVILQDQSDGSVKEDWYFTPIEAGSIRIIAEQGDTLLVQAADGTTFSFDINRRVFEQDTPAITPTAASN